MMATGAWKKILSGTAAIASLTTCGTGQPGDEGRAESNLTLREEQGEEIFRPDQPRLSEEALFKLLGEVGFAPETQEVMACIAEHESQRDPDVVHLNRNGTVDYGLFQINLRWWKVACGISEGEQLFDPQVNARCALKVFRRHGYAGWAVHHKCREQIDDKSIMVALKDG